MGGRLNRAWSGCAAAAAALGLLVPAAALAANTVYLTNGKSIVAKSIQWRDATKDYQVEPVDSAGATVPIPLKDVDRLEIDRPAAWDKAAQAISANQPDAAIPLLEGVIVSHKMLVWDNRARDALARIYMQRKNYAKAIAVLQDELANAPKQAVSPDVRRMYWEALLQTSQTNALRKELDEAVATGAGGAAAVALVIRGNMLRDDGHPDEALADYLGAVLFYEGVKEVQPEALYKAAELLDDLKDPRAAEYRALLTQKYGESDFAKKLADKK